MGTWKHPATGCGSCLCSGKFRLRPAASPSSRPLALRATTLLSFREAVRLGFVHQNSLLFQQGLARSGPTLAEHLKIHALARILLAGSIQNIQVSWAKSNEKIRNLSRLP